MVTMKDHLSSAFSNHEKAGAALRIIEDQLKDPASLANPNHLNTVLSNLAELRRAHSTLGINIQQAYEDVTQGEEP